MTASEHGQDKTSVLLRGHDSQKLWNLVTEEEEKEEIPKFLAFAYWHSHSTKPKKLFYQRNSCQLLSTKKTILPEKQLSPFIYQKDYFTRETAVTFYLPKRLLYYEPKPTRSICK
jgi:hypothetical protein